MTCNRPPVHLSRVPTGAASLFSSNLVWYTIVLSEDHLMDCLLLRHGVAVEWSDWHGEDQARPLTDEGVEKTRKAANGLLRLGVTPTHLLCSPYLRTRQTADLVKDVLGFRAAPRHCVEMLSDGSPEAFISLLTTFSRDDCVLCVGHEPHLGYTAGTMLFGRPVTGLSFKKAGACCIRFDGTPRGGNGTLQWWLQPGQLRVLGKT